MEKKSKGFTLVELLAVIVVLAIILVIAVPQIMDVITESRKGALASSAKLIASSAETAKISNDTLGIEREITCEDVSSYTEEDYTCDLKFENNKPYVTLVGHGKFEGMYVCDATKEDAVITFESCTLVSFSIDLVGGSDTVDYEEKYEPGTKVTIVEPTKEGYTFIGWTVTGSELNDNELTIGTEAVTLTANWTINTYTISYNLNGGTNDEGNPTSATYGETVTINNPTKEGYTFAGWTINEGDGDGLVSGTNVTIGASNVILTANWTINTYTITYELGDGTNAEGNPTSVEYGTTVTINNPTKTGYTFAGWTVTGEGSSLDIDTNKLTIGTEDVTLTAKWTANTYTITYNLNGGTNASGNPTSGTYGSKITLSNPTKEESTFNGWTVTGAELNDNELTIGTSDVTLTANWLEIPFSTDSWATIKAAVKAGNTSKYNVGDTRKVNLGSLGTHTVRIANKTPCSQVSVTSKTACGFVIEFVDIITTQYMNPKGTYLGGWPASTLYSYVNGTIYNALPTDLKNVIINTTVVSSHGNEEESNFTSTDKLYLLSQEEVLGEENSYCDSSIRTSRQLDYYNNYVNEDGTTGITSTNRFGIIKLYNGSACNWWLRSAYSLYEDTFYAVRVDGTLQGNFMVNNEFGVSPAFRLGN